MKTVKRKKGENVNEKFHNIKIVRNKNATEKILIDGTELKGVTQVKVYNSGKADSQDDDSTIVIEIGFIESLEIISN